MPSVRTGGAEFGGDALPSLVLLRLVQVVLVRFAVQQWLLVHLANQLRGVQVVGHYLFRLPAAIPANDTRVPR